MTITSKERILAEYKAFREFLPRDKAIIETMWRLGVTRGAILDAISEANLS